MSVIGSGLVLDMVLAGVFGVPLVVVVWRECRVRRRNLLAVSRMREISQRNGRVG